jgi:PilZ domain-containing protein
MLAIMARSTIKSERRRKDRQRPPSLIYVELPAGNGGMMRDLSEEGFAVRVVIRLRAGDTTPFSFLLGESQRIEGEGQIVWVEENGHVAGVKFTQISAEALEQIRDWMKRPEAAQLREDAAKPPKPPAPTFEQLREEIRGIPAKEGKVGPVADEPHQPVQKTAVPAAQVVAEEAPSNLASTETAPPPQKELAKPVIPPPPVVPPPREEIPPIRKKPERQAPVAAKPVERPTEPIVSPPEAVRKAAPPILTSAETAKVDEEAAKQIALPAPPSPQAPEEIQLKLTKKEKPEPVVAKPSEKVPEPAAPVPKMLPGPERPSLAVVLNLNASAALNAEPPVEKVSQADTAPALPSLILPRAEIVAEEPQAQVWLPKAPANVEVPAKTEMPARAALPAKPPAVQEIREDEQGPAPRPRLPDISTVLIQPSRKRAVPAEDISKWRITTPEDRAPAKKSESWSKDFTPGTAIAIMALLAVSLAIYVFHREVGEGLVWMGQKMSGSGASNSVTAPPPDSGKAPSQPPAKPAKAGKGAAKPPANAERPSAPPATATKDDSSLAIPAAGPDGASTGAAIEAGQTEFLQAMSLLHGGDAKNNLGQAIGLLWTAVEKGNPAAEVALADLYWRGRGVVKNCDQTRILLTAAARKGSADGKKRLQQFQEAGCE